MAQKSREPFNPIPIRDLLLRSKQIESDQNPSLPSTLEDLKRLYYYMHKLGLNDFNDLDCYFVAVRRENFPRAISEKRLADMLERDCKDQHLIPKNHEVERQGDKEKDTKKKSERRVKTGQRNLEEWVRIDKAVTSRRNEDRTMKELALEFTNQNEPKARALLKRYSRNKKQGRLG